jgi:DNA-binding FadR family transcriptional regulator
MERKDNFTLRQDEFDRVTLHCDCGDVMIVEDVLHFRMLMSRFLGRFAASAYTVKNMARMYTFIKKHDRHVKDED